MKHIVVNIGCIECGVPTEIVGVYDNKEQATKDAEACQKLLGWKDGGQNLFQVFDLPESLGMTNTFLEYTKTALSGEPVQSIDRRYEYEKR